MSSYDQDLLGEVPRATRAQLQEGYNVDLLEQPPRRTSSVRNPPLQIPPPAPVNVPLTPAIAETGSGEKFVSPTHNSTAPTSRGSFWRSRNGVITIVVIVVIVIGAVVGGAVGGTVNKNSSNNSVVGTTGTNPSTLSNLSTATVSNSTSTSTSTSNPTAPIASGSSTVAQGVGANRPSATLAAGSAASTG